MDLRDAEDIKKRWQEYTEELYRKDPDNVGVTSHLEPDILEWEDLFCIVILCILATLSQYLPLLLGPYHFCPLLCPSLHEMFPWHL